MTTDEQSDGALVHISYRWLCAALFATTLCEWLVFVERHLWSISERLLVPGLLIVSGLKFLVAISWLIRSPVQLEIGKKAFIVALVMGGGALILLRLLLK